jgi:protein tyrosine phosphatase (PTP) superfamily phosphohydrolase (DUF442 family)
MSNLRFLWAIGPAGFLAAAIGCSPTPTEPAASAREPVGLPNLRSLGDGLWSGGTPDGDEGFQSLHDLGVNTIISVDGMRPDVERARRFGVRYVHIPFGYGGIPHEQAVRLAMAARDLPRPIYVHCHHGQHRGPAAAALMRRCRADGWTANEAVAFLKTAGTDPKYEGLYASVREQPPAPSGEVFFPEVVDIGGLTARMVEIDDLWDGIKKAKANVWKPVADGSHSVAHLAVQLTEQFREAGRLPDTPTRPATFRLQLASAEQAAAELETALRAGDAGAATNAFDRTAATCTACHREHRDNHRP